MNGIDEKSSCRKLFVAILLVCVLAFSIAYALIQTRSSLAVLTTPPPGIPGPYYVTAEAKIYGPVVDLAVIKSKMSGTYASDYTYVQWGTNPFYRAYVDNTLQEVFYGSMVSVMDEFNPINGYPLETSFRNTFDNLKNVGALDPMSELGALHYFGNAPGVYIGVDVKNPNVWETYYLNTSSNSWIAVHAVAAAGYSGWPGYVEIPSTINIYLNGSTIVELTALHTGGDSKLNASGQIFSDLTLLRWTVSGYRAKGNQMEGYACGVIYLGNLVNLETSMPTSNYRVYFVIDSPGTSFVSKHISPSSPMIGSTINVTVRFDPPTANDMNITELYPNTFTWGGQQITLSKYRIGIGLIATTSVSSTLTPVGSNMQFTVYYYQASDILQSVLSDEYIYMSYLITVPNTPGEYTLPAATMSYLIPTPQT